MKPKHTLKVWLIVGALLAMPCSANAAGLGNISVTSALGQPLRAEIQLISVPKDDVDLLVAKVASPEDYVRAGIDRPEGLLSVKFAVEKRADGQPYLKVTSTQPVNEPFLQLLVQLDWPSGRILREYTILLDPPGLRERPATPAISAPVVKTEVPPLQAEPAVVPQKPMAESKVSPAKGGAKALRKQKAETAKGAPAKKPAEVLVHAEPVPALTPAEQTFPHFEGEQAVAPAPAPAPVVATRVEAPQTYTVKKGDTLAKIASEMKPEGYSLDQMLVSLFEANKQAFAGHNMNRLKSGQILKMPEKSSLDAVGKDDAVKEVRAHAADWNAYRQKLAASAAEQKPTEEQEAAGKITAKVEEKAVAPEAAPKEVLRLSKGEAAAEQGKGKATVGGKPGAGAAELKSLQDKLNAAQEEAAAKDKSLKEANSRIAELEKNVQDMKRVLEMQNQQLADMQKQAAAKAAPVAPTGPKPEVVAPMTPAPTPVPPAAKPAEQPQAPIVPAKPAEEQPKPAKPKVKARVVQPVPEPSFLEELLSNPIYLAGGGAVAIGGLLAALWAVGRRRKKSLASFEDSIMTGGDLKANTIFGNTGGGQIDTGDTSFLTDFSQGGMGAIDTNDVDPIAEAEVYMAYGRDAQAEEILKEAMNKDPNRHEVQLKLLEIYAGRKNQAAFETLASELYAATSGQGPIWEKAAELGRTLDAANPLYSASGAAEARPGAAAVAAVGAAGVVAAAAGKAAREPDFSLDLDTEGGLTGAVPAEEPTFEAPLDLDLHVEERPTIAAKEPTAAMETLEFDLGSIIPQAVEKQEEAGGPAAEAPSFSLELPELGELGGEQTQPSAAASPVEADTLGLDFDFNLEPAAEEKTTPKFKAEPEPLMPDLDLSGIDLNVEGGAESVNLDEAITVAGAPGESWEEASTKLDLARAYVEMGDKEGAREILEEVVQEGGPDQKEDAKKLLATLS
jgi:pilus assembly protein FimV